VILLEKSFPLQTHPDEVYFLHFGQINGAVTISLNDVVIYAGEHNYLPLTLALTPEQMSKGTNILRVELRPDARTSRSIPGFQPVNLPRVDSGLLQPVYLEICPAFFVEDTQLRFTDYDSLIHLEGQVTLNRMLPPTRGYRVIVSVQSPEQTIYREIFSPEKEPFREVTFSYWTAESPPTWSPEAPHRYWIEVSLDSAGKPVDVRRQPVAFRTVAVQQHTLLLNRRRISVQGVNYVYQNIDGSELFYPDLIRKDLQTIKQQGFNAVRVIMHPLPEVFYRICDEVGLLCFQDLPFVLPGGAEIHQYAPLFRRWQEYYQHIARLAERYSCLSAMGVAYYMNGASPTQQRQLKAFLETQSPPGIPRYVSTLLPLKTAVPEIDFQIIDVIKRGQAEDEFQKLYRLLGDQLYFPGGFSPDFLHPTAPDDSLRRQMEFRRLLTLYEGLNRNEFPGNLQGHFVFTYNDHFLHFPLLSQALSSEPFRNPVGLVNLQRRVQFSPSSAKTASENSPDASSGELPQHHPMDAYLYILIGFINLFLFLISYQRYRIFRQNLQYSIKKPHGFFVNLQERIIIPTKESLFLLFTIAVNGALVFSAAGYYYRNNFLFDYLLSVITRSPELKYGLAYLIWHQPLFLIVAALTIIVFFYGLALIIKLFSLFGESRVFFNQALAVSIWSAAPFVFLLPLGIFMYSILMGLKSYWILVGVLLYFHVWSYFRWINGIRVLTDRLYSRVFLLFTILLVALIVGGGYWYDHQFHVREHLRLVYQLHQW
ncbi:MAG: hypothetical protein D6681_19135, partial [Calditrichaeota bacterium]